jgi:hypothetical protein
VKRITSSGDKSVPDLLNLYAKLFPEEEGTNYSVDEFHQIMDVEFEEKRHVEVENIVLAATHKKEVVGFLFCHLYPKKRKALISYFGIKKEVLAARRVGPNRELGAARKLLVRLHDILLKDKNCDFLFFDLEGFNPDSPPEIKIERRARRVLFRNSATALGYKAQEFQFDYHCPKVALTEGTRESPFSLFCIGITQPIPHEVDKTTMMDFLRFIYIDGYGDFYAVSDPRFKEHHRYLEASLAEYEAILPEVIRAT